MKRFKDKATGWQKIRLPLNDTETLTCTRSTHLNFNNAYDNPMLLRLNQNHKEESGSQRTNYHFTSERIPTVQGWVISDLSVVQGSTGITEAISDIGLHHPEYKELSKDQ